MALLGQFRRDTLANWRSNNPVLADGEFALVASNSSQPKKYDYWVCGDGTTPFNNLPMLSLASSVGITGITDIIGDSSSLAASQKLVTDKINALQQDLQQEIDKKYTKPSTGIPDTDMTESVRGSLELANSSVTLNEYTIDVEQGLLLDVRGNSYLVRIGDGFTDAIYLISCEDDYTNTRVNELTSYVDSDIGFYLCYSGKLLFWASSTTKFSIISLRENGTIDAEIIDEMPVDFEVIDPERYATQKLVIEKFSDIPVEEGRFPKSIQQKGTNAVANAPGASAFGFDTIASAPGAHVEGGDNLEGGEPAAGEEKLYAIAEGYASHAEGAANAKGRYSHAEGGGNRIEKGYPTRSTAEGQYSHAEGSHTYAKGGMTHAEGNLTIAEGYGSHAEGSKTLTTGNTSHAEGINTVAGVGNRPEVSTNTDNGNYSHAEGNGTQASGNSSHSEGKHTLAEGPYSHAEGINTRASGQNSHAEGHSQTNVLDTTVVKSNDGIIEDWNLNKFTLAKGAASHAEGKDNLALGARSHAEGYQTIASGGNSHSENYNTKATGANSHAEGASCEAKGERSHVEGFHTETNNASEHAEGSYNKSNTDTRHSVGIGTSESDRKNAFEVMKNGEIYIIGVGGYDGTNPTSQVNSLQKVLEGLGVTIDWTKLGYNG